ncbi:MAG: hypothetical protein QGG88_04935 [Gammaproteobacteria bacterium]|nr:hypothetical protein [Gammaproteobacteria bacterium]
MNHHQDFSEAVRLQYLAAMGITSWLPLHDRVVTTGAVWQAKTSLSVALVEAPQPEAPISAVSVAEHHVEPAQSHPDHNTDQAPPLGITAEQAKQQTRQIRDTLLQEPLASEPVKPAVKAAMVATVPSTDDQIEPLHLSYSWYSAGVLVVNEVPLQDGAAMTSSLAQLQTAMVNALNPSCKAVMPQSQGEFHWPLVPGLHGDHSRSGAQQALQYQLQKLLQDKPVKQVMLMGQRCAELLLADAVKPGTVFSDEQWPAAQILLTHSLHQLLKIPANKAEVWTHMQPLLAK